MNHRGINGILGIALWTLVAVGQQSPPPGTAINETAKPGRFLLRVSRFDQNVRDCMLLLPDGRYHREHSEEQPASFSRTPLHKSQAYEIHVFEGQLTPEEIGSVAAAIGRPEFRAIIRPEKLHLSPEFFEALVLREGEAPQSFTLSATTDYKPNQLALKPLFAWMDAMQRRKRDVSKSEDDQCRIPDEWKPRIQLRDIPPPKP